MSNNGEDIIRETFEKLGAAIGVQMQMPDAMIANLGAVLQAQIDLLAELQSTGRLVPTGGMALTAEDVRKFIIAIERHYPEGEAELLARLRALFPATEPAEEAVGDPLQAWKEFLKPKPIGWYRTMTPKFATEYFGFPDGSVLGQTHTASDGGTWGWCGDDWELRCYPPAPAEPAEEETKAEDYCCHPMCRHTNWGGSNRKHTRGSDCPIVPKPTSSPVVPAPTETGPWA
ncbi:hypothetical protein [Rhodococcus qingshengii]|uniref:hypothetical protein n=1 Tax=Rhodococcus qingshengii TaxID=334542 RepID=UPI00301AF5F6